MRSPSTGCWSGNAAASALAGLIRPTSYCAKFLVGEIDDRGTRRRQELARGIARVVGVEQPVVADDHDAVLGHARVELERRHADRERPREPGERVLGGEAARAAMALQVEILCAHGQRD